MYRAEHMNTNSANASLYRDLISRACGIAGHWYNTTMSWWEDWMQPTRAIGGRSDAARIAESLIMELVQQGRLLEDKKLLSRRESLASRGMADYSWLVTEKSQPYDVSDVDRLELEQLCRQVAPESCGRVIREFRSALLRDPSPSDLPNIMRAIVRRVIFEQRDSCSAADGTSTWLGQSLTNLRSRFLPSSASSGGSDDLELSASVINSMELGSVDDALL